MEKQRDGREIIVRKEYGKEEEYSEHLKSDGKFPLQSIEVKLKGIAQARINIDGEDVRVTTLPNTYVEMIVFISKIAGWLIRWLIGKWIGK